jgi:hypothetical protein
VWPENLAAICLPLSDDASWVTGEVWSINGGITYRRNAAGGLAAWLAILVLQMKSFGATVTRHIDSAVSEPRLTA